MIDSLLEGNVSVVIQGSQTRAGRGAAGNEELSPGVGGKLRWRYCRCGG
jgi:hypothetical protein